MSLDFRGLLPELDVHVPGFSNLTASTLGFGVAVLAPAGMVVIAYHEKLRHRFAAGANPVVRRSRDLAFGQIVTVFADGSGTKTEMRSRMVR